MAHPKPATPKPPVPKEPAAPTDEEIEQILNEPDGAVEITEPMTMPEPGEGTNSIPGIQRLKTKIGTGVRVQAVGWHSSGYLKAAVGFPPSGPGFFSRDHGKKDFATDLTTDLLRKALGHVEESYPGRPPIVIGNISNKTGGKITNLSGRSHKSHQTGLDVDIGIPSFTSVKTFWSPCARLGCASDSLSKNMDVERFWLFVKQVACADKQPVIAIFINQQIKKRVCEYVRHTAKENMNDECVFKALRVLRNEPNHTNHMHLRLRCPENQACQNSMVTLANKTGC